MATQLVRGGAPLVSQTLLFTPQPATPDLHCGACPSPGLLLLTPSRVPWSPRPLTCELALLQEALQEGRV